jgi:hypothetical protein
LTEKRNQRELLWFQTGEALNFITAAPHCGELFFDDDLINSLVINTNLYADQYTQAHIQLFPHARSTDWTPVDAKDMKFLGMILLMGIVKLPALDLYWLRRVLYRLPCFAAVMTRKHFQVSLLHLILK